MRRGGGWLGSAALAVAACLGMAWSPSARGQPSVGIVGIGAASCAEFQRDIAGNANAERTYLAWAQGYLSGVLRASPPGVDDGLALLPAWLPLDQQAAFLRNACRADGRADYVDAVDALLVRLRQGPGR